MALFITSRRFHHLTPVFTSRTSAIFDPMASKHISISFQKFSTQGTTDFGYKQVPLGEKENLVHEVFSKVATKYDLMNDLMSAGIHRLWKDDFVEMMGIPYIDVPKGTYLRHLDVAGGTGDIAFRSVEQIARNHKIIENNTPIDDADRQVVVCDINPNMLAVGKQRCPSAIGKTNAHMVGFVEGNAETLPFNDNSFDIYSIAFGLRNITNKDKAIEEAYRVLRPGGRLMILEFSHLTNPNLQYLYDLYSFNVIPPLGQVIANDRDSYQYLVESIRKFPKQQELLEMLKSVNFKACSYRNLNFGMVAIHSGYKL